MTIMLFVGMFSSLGVNCSEEFQALTIIAGVTLGSGLWWLFVSLFLRKTRNYLSANAINRINHLSGVILIGFAAWAILPDLWNYLYPVAGCGCGS
jgi:threonine/homoserine/homoserine lactone efflux protein